MWWLYPLVTSVSIKCWPIAKVTLKLFPPFCKSHFPKMAVLQKRINLGWTLWKVYLWWGLIFCRNLIIFNFSGLNFPKMSRRPSGRIPLKSQLNLIFEEESERLARNLKTRRKKLKHEPHNPFPILPLPDHSKSIGKFG